jgi:hypothetical protein
MRAILAGSRKLEAEVSQSAVSRILFPAFRRDDDHSSSPFIAEGIQRPTRRHWAGNP